MEAQKPSGIMIAALPAHGAGAKDVLGVSVWLVVAHADEIPMAMTRPIGPLLFITNIPHG
jgi:hypothetical protein